MDPFTFDDNNFLLYGKPFRVLSGALHYFRVLPELWDDRMAKLKAMGLNTLETYVAWNLHEPKPGVFNFEGQLDIVKFINLAAKHGLQVIVRPGPYICSEWDLGGLPAWLLKDSDMQLRCAYPPFLMAVDRFFDALLPRLVPLQISQGGPIIALQIENEYGSYGNDKNYLTYLEKGLYNRDIDVLLFTSDGPTDEMLQYGTLPHVLKTVNFGSKAETAFARLKEFQPSGPLMCMEFWNGWFDHWGEEHHKRTPEAAVAELEQILAAGASVNFYMFHGGSNFGFMNGANARPARSYQPTINSYDSDAPLDEAGDPTPKYLAFREVLGRYTKLDDLPVPQPAPKMALGEVRLTESADLFDALDVLSKPVFSAVPLSMEQLDQNYGFILYSAQVSGPRDEVPLTIDGLGDRAQVFLNGVPVGVLEREFPDRTLSIIIPAEGAMIDILVENMGRVNFGPDLFDRKGINGGVRLGQQFLFNWRISPLPLDNLARLPFTTPVVKNGPRFYRGSFEVSELKDTFLTLPGWDKGVCWINGFNLGRYWKRGPQRSIYVPAPLLKTGSNELVILELHETTQESVVFTDKAQLEL
jgi:beta-galactosidase